MLKSIKSVSRRELLTFKVISRVFSTCSKIWLYSYFQQFCSLTSSCFVRETDFSFLFHCWIECGLFTWLCQMKTLIFLISVFLKLKWYRAMKFYLLFVFLFALFFVSLCGFALAHYGNVYEEQPKLGHKVSNGMEWKYNSRSDVLYSFAFFKEGSLLPFLFH